MKTIDIEGFPITPDMSLSNRGEHFDIAYSISNHGRRKWEHGDTYRPHGGTWCYYVYINEMMLSPEEFEEFWLPKAEGNSWLKRGKWQFASYDYYKPRWSDAEWHGGVTYYSKENGHDGDPRGVKIGCDFAHSWDDGHSFYYGGVERECRRTIDRLREMYKFFRRCAYSGVWLPAAEMVEKDGKLYTAKAIEDMKKWDEERAARKAAA